MVSVYHYDAFSVMPGKGNPAGIVLDGEQLTEEQMLAVAQQVGFNECAFPLASSVADIRIRFFTPGHETPLCGHATMASIAALLEQGRLPKKDEYTIETLAGVLTVRVASQDGFLRIRMAHARPQFVPFTGDVAALARAMNISVSQIDHRYPIVYGSTGAWTLCVPVALDAFAEMRPDTVMYPHILVDMPTASVHPFSIGAVNADADLHARHFSNPISGTVEDAITGTASGVMGAYMATYVQPERTDDYTLVVEQGAEVGKDGRVYVHIEQQDGLAIAITGTAVFVRQFEV